MEKQQPRKRLPARAPNPLGWAGGTPPPHHELGAAPLLYAFVFVRGNVQNLI
jgi:hypothetical protein